jgi:hypothetical protein
MKSSVLLFRDDDDGYLKWISDHRDGFVLNASRVPTASYLILHRASCRDISTPTRSNWRRPDIRNGPASMVDPKYKMTIIASVLSDEDPDFNAAANRIAQIPPAKKKKVLVDELSKLEGKPFICQAIRNAPKRSQLRCGKAADRRELSGARR